MPELNLTNQLGTALSIDYTEQFGLRVNSLIDLLGIHRVMPVANGTTIKTYTSSVTLDNTEVAPGAVIPLSEVKLEDGPVHTIKWDKKRKAVTVEDIQAFGFERAITRTDEKLLNSIQKEIRNGLIENLATGTGTQEGTDFKQLLANNTAAVKVAFEEDDPEVISFANTFDAYEYLGDANITTQTAFGMTYLEGFMDNKIVFLSGDIPKGTVYSTAVDNLMLYFVDVSSGDIAGAFDFVTQDEGIIGVTHDINKQRLTAETVTLYGIVWLAEILSGVIKGTIVAGA